MSKMPRGEDENTLPIQDNYKCTSHIQVANMLPVSAKLDPSGTNERGPERSSRQSARLLPES